MYFLLQPRMRAVSFTWHGRNKAKGAFFLGTSPEFDMAVYSICALEYRNTLCEFILEGVKVAVQTYDINHRAGLQIGSAWPAI